MNRPRPQKTFSIAELTEADNDMTGFCVICGTSHDACEPDARNIACTGCGELEVFGAEEIMVMGLIAR